MSDHSAAQNLSVKYSRLRNDYSLDAVRRTWSDCEDADSPESSKSVGPQQWARG